MIVDTLASLPAIGSNGSPVMAIFYMLLLAAFIGSVLIYALSSVGNNSIQAQRKAADEAFTNSVGPGAPSALRINSKEILNSPSAKSSALRPEQSTADSQVRRHDRYRDQRVTHPTRARRFILQHLGNFMPGPQEEAMTADTLFDRFCQCDGEAGQPCSAAEFRQNLEALVEEGMLRSMVGTQRNSNKRRRHTRYRLAKAPEESIPSMM